MVWCVSSNGFLLPRMTSRPIIFMCLRSYWRYVIVNQSETIVMLVVQCSSSGSCIKVRVVQGGVSASYVGITVFFFSRT